MAQKRSKVFLGFEDEIITDKFKSQVSFTTNKIGGKPDWPVESVTAPLCKRCGFSLPLILQIYAPLENSAFHRTLYLFGCVNPYCWNQSDSWVCLRSQVIDASFKEKSSNFSTASSVVLSASDWCAEADDWDEDAENGNVASFDQHTALSNSGDLDRSGSPDSADEDLDGQSTDALSSHFEGLRVGGMAHCDANSNAPYSQGRAEGARGNVHSPQATAEIEGDESELVSIDTPTGPQLDLYALLQESSPLPKEIHCPQFVPLFLSVYEEDISGQEQEMSAHVRLLLAQYQKTQAQSGEFDVQENPGAGGGGSDVEKYERSLPAHGDVLFHNFVERIQENPGQVLRYCRDGGSPLLIAPLTNIPLSCPACRGDMVFELQVLPSLITKLKLQEAEGDLNSYRIEFGSVLIWTCRQSCWASGDVVREEKVIVQAELM